MAKSENLKQKHAQQTAAALAEFEAYKSFIVKEFIEKFGGSYQNAESMKDVWRTAFVYTPECEKFLVKKTLFYIYMLGTSKNGVSPRFLRVLTSRISEYLSYYLCKKGISNHLCAQQLRILFFVENQHVKEEIRKYQHAEKKAKTPKQNKNKFIKQTSGKTVLKTIETEEEDIRKNRRKKYKKIIAFKILIDEYIR